MAYCAVVFRTVIYFFLGFFTTKRPTFISENRVYYIFNKKPKLLENSQLLRKTRQGEFELILEQCVANYYRDNTIAK